LDDKLRDIADKYNKCIAKPEATAQSLREHLQGLNKHVKFIAESGPKALHEPHQQQRMRLYSEQIDNSSQAF
jgi:hypothetical protein